MEWENLKEAWTTLDNRLKRNEELCESIILAEMRSKAGKIVNRFIILEKITVVVLLLLLPFLIYALNRSGGKIFTWDVIMIFCAIICFLYPFRGIYKLHGLMKIDITKNVANNILFLNKYNIQINHEKKLNFYFIFPLLGILAVCTYAEAKASLPLWIFLICMLCLAGLKIYWDNKKYNKGFESVMRSLEEIRELKEE